jgi:hypothetical protein
VGGVRRRDSGAGRTVRRRSHCGPAGATTIVTAVPSGASTTPNLRSPSVSLNPARIVTQRTRWTHFADVIGNVAVVISLIYVGIQIRQNTAAIQTSTSQSVYELHQDRTLMEIESADVAALLVRVERRPDLVTAEDSLRYRRHMNLNMNLQEAVYTNALQGTLEPEIAAGWLQGMSVILCRPWMREYWEDRKSGYHVAFQAAMDSAAAETVC